MLGDHVGLANHVVVEEQEDVPRCFGRAAIPGRARAPIFLLDDAQGEVAVELS